MSSYQRQSLETLVINNGRSSKCATGSEVWNLNLDQIESGTGCVLAKQIVSVDGLGPSTFPFEAGTVLYSKLRPYLNKVIVADEDGVATTELVPLRCDPEKLLPEYLAYYLRSPEFLGFANVVVAGAKMPRMVMGEFWKHQIPLPSLPEQRRIAAILDQADALRAKRREALAELDQLTQSIFIEMFGGVQTIHNKWPVKPLGEMLEFLTSGSRGWAQHYTDSGDLFLRIQNVRYDELDLSDVAYVSAPASAEAKRTEIHEGDVLLSITADLGRSAVVPKGIGKAHINQHLSILRTKSLVPRYLSAFIASPAGKQEVMGRNKQGVKAGLNFDDIKSFRVPVPPDILQREFAMRADEVGKQVRVYSRSIKQLDSLFSSLQHRAFRGEL